MRHPIPRPFVLAALAAAVVLLPACNRASGDRGPEARAGGREAERPSEAVPVETAPVRRGSIEAVLRLTSALEAERAVTVYAQAPRLVTRLLVEEGDRVARGQLLLQLQDDEQRLALERTRIQLDQARREFERQKSLFEQGLASEQVYNDARHALDQAEVAHKEAQRALEYTRVTAPIAGTVTERLVNLGDSVTVNQPLFRIVDFDSIVARVYVPEKDLSRLAVGQPARVHVPALGRSVAGRILRIAPVVDPKTGTVKVTVKVPYEAGLRPGLYVEVELVTDVHEHALLVPKRALVYDADRIFAFVVTPERTARRVAVEPVLENAEWVEPAGGFEEGDLVVVAGQAGLKEGVRVRLPGEEPPADREGGARPRRPGARDAGSPSSGVHEGRRPRRGRRSGGGSEPTPRPTAGAGEDGR